jgi:2'-5' RNA ligase
MRLFTAVWPPADALDRLGDAVAGIADLPGWRPVPRERWHLTLAFHGEDDPDRRAADLDALAGAPSPRLRLAGSGSFPGVLWAGLQTLDRAALDALVAGAGGDPATFVGHLTLARRSGRRGGRPAVPDVPPGPWWSPGEVLLVASERDAAGLRYRPVHRVPLRS